MWNEQIIMMLLEGIKDTLYMTLTSTLIGYVIGLPMGILLTVTDKDGIHPNAAVYKVLDVIEPDPKCTVFDFTDRADSVYKISDRKKLWTDSDDRSACHSSSTIYCTNGGIFFKGSGRRCH